jgi:hypothetical protein
MIFSAWSQAKLHKRLKEKDFLRGRGLALPVSAEFPVNAELPATSRLWASKA